MALHATPPGHSTQPRFATALPSADCSQSARRLPPVTSLIIRWQKTRSEHKKKISEIVASEEWQVTRKEQTLRPPAFPRRVTTARRAFPQAASKKQAFFPSSWPSSWLHGVRRGIGVSSSL